MLLVRREIGQPRSDSTAPRTVLKAYFQSHLELNLSQTLVVRSTNAQLLSLFEHAYLQLCASMFGTDRLARYQLRMPSAVAVLRKGPSLPSSADGDTRRSVTFDVLWEVPLKSLSEFRKASADTRFARMIGQFAEVGRLTTRTAWKSHRCLIAPQIYASLKVAKHLPASLWPIRLYPDSSAVAPSRRWLGF
jgi:hypothetical protein